MYKTRKECRDETGLEPEDISKLARSHPAMARLPKIGKVMTHEERVEFVYEGVKSNYQKQQRLASQTSLDSFVSKDADSSQAKCTGLNTCLHCEEVRRNRYMKARRDAVRTGDVFGEFNNHRYY